MKILSVVGTRPQFVKAGPVSKAIRSAGHGEILVHTGQHYDPALSDVFFEDLEIPRPDINLNVGSGSHARQTGEMLMGIGDVMAAEKPDWVLVFGDTNSTLAAVLAAAKLCIKIAHVEAGLRCYRRTMPEEINRVMADHVSDMLFCPSEVAAKNLAAEGITKGVYVVGDVMVDALESVAERARRNSGILDRLMLSHRGYLLATIHRAENTDNTRRLKRILCAFQHSPDMIVFPLHPRTRKMIHQLDGAVDLDALAAKVMMIEPVGYLDNIRLIQSARMVLTDSGGMQKEAYWLGVPCVTLRDETEWTETVDAGWNVLAGDNESRILGAIHGASPAGSRPRLYGDAKAAQRISTLLSQAA